MAQNLHQRHMYECNKGAEGEEGLQKGAPMVECFRHYYQIYTTPIHFTQ